MKNVLVEVDRLDEYVQCSDGIRVVSADKANDLAVMFRDYSGDIVEFQPVALYKNTKAPDSVAKGILVGLEYSPLPKPTPKPAKKKPAVGKGK